jgi:hypothetical protein
MKSIILLSTLFLFSITSFSQDLDSAMLKVSPFDCSAITKETDEFSGEITFTAKIDAKDDGDVSFIKVIKVKTITYYLSIWIKESGIYTGTGLSIILKNGKIINKPDEKVDYTYAGSNFYTKAFIRLNANDIALFKTSGISKYKLYISKGEIEEQSDLAKDYFNCLLKCK